MSKMSSKSELTETCKATDLIYHYDLFRNANDALVAHYKKIGMEIPAYYKSNPVANFKKGFDSLIGPLMVRTGGLDAFVIQVLNDVVLEHESKLSI